MLRNNTFVKVISLVIAIVLWAYVIQVTNPTKNEKYDNIPITIVNQAALEERGLTVLSTDDTAVTVNIQGKKSEFVKMNKNDITASIDVAGYDRGENSVNVVISIPNSMTLISKTPEKVKVTIDKLVSEYKPVVAIVSGELAAGTELGNITTDVEEVMVQGAKTLVDSISYMKATIEAGSITADKTSQQVTLVPVDSSGKEVAKVTMGQSKVHVSSMFYYTKTVALTVNTVGEIPEGYQVGKISSPETITIKGSKAVLNSINEIVGEIDISAASLDSTGSRLPVTLKLPQGTSLSGSGTDISAAVTLIEANNSQEPDMPHE